MLRKVMIEDAGDTDFLPGQTVDLTLLDEVNKQMLEQDKEPATAKRLLLGIRKASLESNSFLAAAAFESTSNALTAAAVSGKIDPLMGLEENVIVGKLIPAGTGLKQYRRINAIKNEEKIAMLQNLERDNSNKFNLNDNQ